VIRVSNDYYSFNESLKEGLLLSQFKPDAIVNRQLFSLAHMLHNGVIKTDELVIPSFRKETKPSTVEQLNNFFGNLLARLHEDKKDS
jgi:pilus assembly protein CpaE